jgi:hypothetical protein
MTKEFAQLWNVVSMLTLLIGVFVFVFHKAINRWPRINEVRQMIVKLIRINS